MLLKLSRTGRLSSLHQTSLYFWKDYSNVEIIEQSPLEAASVYSGIEYPVAAVIALRHIGKYKESHRVSNMLVELSKGYFEANDRYRWPSSSPLRFITRNKEAIRSEAFTAVVDIAKEKYSAESFELITNEIYSMIKFRYHADIYIDPKNLEKLYSLTVIASLVPQDRLAVRIQSFFDEKTYAALALGYLLIKGADKKWAVQVMKNQVITSLEDSSPQIRLLAINALQEFAEPELIEHVMPRILKCLDDDNANIRQSAWKLVTLSNTAVGIWI